MPKFLKHAKKCQKMRKKAKNTTTEKCVKVQPSICLEKNYTDQEMSHVSWIGKIHQQVTKSHMSWIGTLELNEDA